MHGFPDSFCFKFIKNLRIRAALTTHHHNKWKSKFLPGNLELQVLNKHRFNVFSIAQTLSHAETTSNIDLPEQDVPEAPAKSKRGRKKSTQSKSTKKEKR